MNSDYNIQLKEISKAFLTIKKECADKINNSLVKLDLDSSLAIYFLHHSDKQKSIFKSEADSFMNSYVFSETNIALLGMLAELKLINIEQNKTLFENSIAQLMRKKNVEGGVNFSTRIRLIIGIALGFNAFAIRQVAQFNWIKTILEAIINNKETSIRDIIIANYLIDILEGKDSVIGSLSGMNYQELKDQIAALWLIIERPDKIAELNKLKETLINGIYLIDASRLETFEAAMLCYIIDQVLGNAASVLGSKGTDYLIELLEKFVSCTKRETRLKDEKDVQRVLWTMLNANYDDVVDEEYLSRFGLKNYKFDFGIKHIKIIIEAKYIKLKTDVKQIQDEMLADTRGYLQSTKEFNKMIFFIYDCSPEFKLYKNIQFINDLESIDCVEKVVVVPGRMPKNKQRRKKLIK